MEKRGPSRRLVDGIKQRELLKIFLVLSVTTVATSVFDMLVFRINGVNSSTLVGIAFGAACFIRCRLFLSRHHNGFVLSELYMLRIIVVLGLVLMLTSLLLALHQLIARFDSRFIVSRIELVMALSSSISLAVGVFVLFDRRRIRKLCTRVAEYADSVGQYGTIDGLDQACTGDGSSPRGISVVTGSTAALFGAFVLTKTEVFPFVTKAVELMLLTFFTKGMICLAYETMLVTRREKNRALILI